MGDVNGCTRITHCNAYLDWRVGSGNSVEIFDIEVPSEDRRCGMGRKLINALLDSLPDGVFVWAMTRPSNHVAQQFYEEMHFRVCGYLRNIYGDRDDAVVYGKRKGDQS